MAKDWKGVAATRETLETALWKTPGSVSVRKNVGVRLESGFWFLSPKEGRKRWKLEPVSIGCKLVEILDEDASKILKGILVKPEVGDAPDMYRRVVIFSERLVLLKDHTLPKGRQLRDAHPAELFDRTRGQEVKQRSEDQL